MAPKILDFKCAIITGGAGGLGEYSTFWKQREENEEEQEGFIHSPWRCIPGDIWQP